MTLAFFIEVVVTLMLMEHLMYVIVLVCITSHIVASILSGFLSPNYIGNQRSLTTSMSLIFDFHTR